jgi:hypothetical protein
MKADVILQYLTHQAVDPASHRSQQHKLSAAVLVGPERPFHRVQLPAKFAYSLLQLYLFPLVLGHGISPLADSDSS